MVLVPESQGPESEIPESQVPISPHVFDDGSTLAGARKPWIQQRFFAVFLASSLIFHLSLLALVALFDLRWDAPHAKEVEIPIELIDEKQIQNEQSKSGSGQPPPPAAETPQSQKSEKAAPSESTSEPEKQAASPEKAKEEPKPEAEKPQAQSEKPPEPAKEQPKPPEPKSAETKSAQPAAPQPRAAQSAQQSMPDPAKPEPLKPEPPKPSVAEAVDPKPPTDEVPKPESKPQIAALPQQPPAEHEQIPQTQPPAQSAMDQPRQSAQSPAVVLPSSQLPLFYRSNDQFTLAIPAPLPTNDESAEPVSYKLIVFSKLERFKEYPKSAIARHAVGEVSVFFSIDDTGQPQDISMLQSSGEEDLDAEALAIISRAAPYPIPPEGAQRDFAVTIGFNSRFGSTP